LYRTRFTDRSQQPLKVDVGLAIPPTSLEQIPKALREDWFTHPNAPEMIINAKKDFERRAAEDYYSEYELDPSLSIVCSY
jgi:hypothetical protein